MGLATPKMLRFQPIPFNFFSTVPLKPRKTNPVIIATMTSKLTGGYLISDKRIQRSIKG